MRPGLLPTLLATIPLAALAGAQPPPLTQSDIWRPLPGRSMRSSSADANWRDGNADARPIEPGKTLTIAELQGPGIIQHIWFTIAAKDPHYHRTLTLRIYWDGSLAPAVQTPVGDFFAVGHGLNNVTVNSIPVHVSSEGRALNCYWPMPFRRQARITITNDSPEYRCDAFFWYVDWLQVGSLPEETRYFHAQYRQEFPASEGDYLILDTEGRGHFVGVVYSAQMSMPGWFGEGDDRFYIDGEAEPSLRGTGTEDYFCDAWGFRGFTGPYYGVPLWEGFDIGDRGTVYRWHIPDPVHFTKSLKVTIEHKGSYVNDAGEYISHFKERPDYLSSCAFWYQVPPARRYPPLPPGPERIPPGGAIVIEGESLIDTALKSDDGQLHTQDGGWSGGRQLFFTPHAEGAFVELTFEVPEDGLYEVAGLVTQSWDYGIYEVALDGNPVARRYNLYNETVRTEKLKWGRHQLTGGPHKLRFSAVGTTPISGGYFFGLDAILLRPLG